MPMIGRRERGDSEVELFETVLVDGIDIMVESSRTVLDVLRNFFARPFGEATKAGKTSVSSPEDIPEVECTEERGFEDLCLFLLNMDGMMRCLMSFNVCNDENIRETNLHRYTVKYQMKLLVV